LRVAPKYPGAWALASVPAVSGFFGTRAGATRGAIAFPATDCGFA